MALIEPFKKEPFYLSFEGLKKTKLLFKKAETEVIIC